MITATNLQLYYDRIELDGPVPVTREGLARLHRAHMHAIPFENFDVLMRQQISTQDDGVFDKLVNRRRGGYCFETNLLLCNMLQAAGFQARLLLGRVMFGTPAGVPARLHALVLAQAEGVEYIVDAGFGSHTPRCPIPLVDGAIVHDCGRTWRLTEDAEFGWRLMDHQPDGWRDLYVFDLARVYPMDLHLGNHWTATCPISPFLANALVVRHTDEGRLTLLGRRYARYVRSEIDSRLLKDLPDFQEVVLQEFGISLRLDENEWQTLWERLSPPQMQIDW